MLMFSYASKIAEIKQKRQQNTVYDLLLKLERIGRTAEGNITEKIV
jgi:hypothetical protein